MTNRIRTVFIPDFCRWILPGFRIKGPPPEDSGCTRCISPGPEGQDRARHCGPWGAGQGMLAKGLFTLYNLRLRFVFTARVRSTREGTVCTGVASAGGGGGTASDWWGGIPPSQVQVEGEYPLPRSRGGTPFPGPGRGVPHSQVQVEGTPSQAQVGEYPLPRSRWGVTPNKTA